MRYARLVGLLLVILGLWLVPSAIRIPSATAQGTPMFFTANANLSGAEEVPPVTDTTATGTATYRLVSGGQALQYTLVAFGFTSQPIAAHIHAPAPRGVNAPIVAFLFPPNPHSSCSSTTTVILQCAGQITAADLVGPLAGQPLSALIAQMAVGFSYTNAHTTLHPGGEIRGQNETSVPFNTSVLQPLVRCRSSLLNLRGFTGIGAARRCNG
jgi:hypothetical protein